MKLPNIAWEFVRNIRGSVDKNFVTYEQHLEREFFKKFIKALDEQDNPRHGKSEVPLWVKMRITKKIHQMEKKYGRRNILDKNSSLSNVGSGSPDGSIVETVLSSTH